MKVQVPNLHCLSVQYCKLKKYLTLIHEKIIKIDRKLFIENFYTYDTYEKNMLLKLKCLDIDQILKNLP